MGEEVGSLEQMSGTASKEISSMLLTSIKRVEQIVSDNKSSSSAMLQETSRHHVFLEERVKACGTVFERIFSSTLVVVTRRKP